MSDRPRRLVVVFGAATDIGKTWVGCRVLEAARAAGQRVAARKPVQSFAPGSATDADLLAAATGEAPTDVCPEHRWYPVAVAPPMAATWLGRPGIAVADLAAEITWPAGIDVGLVETAGGPRSPVAHDGDGLALAEILRPDLTILVADAALGTINAVRLAANAIAPTSLIVVLNRFDPDDRLHTANLAWLSDVDGLAVVTEPADVVTALR